MASLWRSSDLRIFKAAADVLLVQAYIHNAVSLTGGTKLEVKFIGH